MRETDVYEQLKGSSRTPGDDVGTVWTEDTGDRRCGSHDFHV